MKIGILTFFEANNYGAILQAFSLQKKTEELYGQCECINYRCQAISEAHAVGSFKLSKGLKYSIRSLIKKIYYWPRISSFNKFRNRIPHSLLYIKNNISNANSKYDVFITGSDQVFNLNLTGGDTTFFLDFVNGRQKKVAFAASMGSYIKEKEDLYLQYLDSFDLLSVREETTQRLINERLGIVCKVIPDPVFLHSGEEWRKLLNIKVNKIESYVLVYSLFGSQLLYETAQRVAKEKRSKIYVITKSRSVKIKPDKLFHYASPEEFVQLINDAETVITDSFHGTAFSLILQKQFYVVLPPKAPDRIIDLLHKGNFSNRIVNGMSDTLEEEVSFEEMKIFTDRLKEQGVSFLKKIGDR